MADNKFQRRISTDKFGNPFQVVGCKPNKKNSDFNVGYADLGGKTYKIEVSKASKDDVDYWVRITKMDEKRKATSM